MLTAVQEWLADERTASARLLVLTRGAVAAGEEDVTDLAGAAVWGLVRAAQGSIRGGSCSWTPTPVPRAP
ncbi:hypothetical protein ACFQ3Z_04955 [Streptomyces nogalater]